MSSPQNLEPGSPDGSTGAADPWPEEQRYERIRSLGRGGHGVVHEVFDRLRQRRIALKTLYQSTPFSLFDLKQEFRALAELRHPNLVHLYELVSPASGVEYFTMELVVGQDFRHYVRHVQESAGSPATLEATLTVSDRAAPVATASLNDTRAPTAGESTPAKLPELRAALAQLVVGLRALHGFGKLHRDIKPSNVMVSGEGRLVILDFGLSTNLAHREAPEHVAGTPEYMAPEQALNEPLQPASDWYAVGVLLFDALVGHPPFQGALNDVFHEKLCSEAPRPSQLVSGVPADLDDLCVRLLARDPSERPTGKEIAELLDAAPRAHSGRPSLLPSALVGRQREVELLERTFQDTSQQGLRAVIVRGPSGIGKSSLVSYFVEGLAREGRATVFRSRVYEQESIPFKAVDGILDQVSQQLEAAAHGGRELPLGPGFQALGQLFPVLRRIRAFTSEAPGGPADPLRTRERAFEGLRHVLAHLARDKTIVVAIDDVQWGDPDSVALLSDLLTKAPSLPLLLLLSHREPDPESNPFLGALAAAWPATVSRVDLPLGPLSASDICRLLTETQGTTEEQSQSVAERVFQMSTGNAFLVQELAHALLSELKMPNAISVLGQSPLGASWLDNRLRDLDGAALRLLEIVATSGRALSTETIARAAGVDREVDAAVSALSQRRLIRSAHQAGLEVLEVRHDRIRDWILLRLPESELRARHRRLAQTLEAMPQTDPDAWLEHWLRSGDGAEIRRVALAAAGRAAERLALKRAESLYETALAHVDGDAQQSISIYRDLARVREWDGRGADAARAYTQAAALSQGPERSALESTAGMLLIYGGSFVEGSRLLLASLRELGVPAPTSRLAALAALVVGRVRLTGLESRLRRVPTLGAPAAASARVEVLHAAAFGFVFTDPLLGECMQVAHLEAALDEGNAAQRARALALEASQRAHRSRPGAASAERLFQRAEELARASADPAYVDFVQACRGVSQFLCGNWRAAHQLLDGAYRDVPRHTAGWHTSAWIYDVLSLCNQGQFKSVAERLPGLLDAADARGDRFTASSLRVCAQVPLLLANDDPATARLQLRDGMVIWDQPSFLVQHWRAMWWSAEVELYDGQPGAAWARCVRDERRLQKSFLLRVQYIRAMTLFLRARCALATFDEDPKSRAKQLRGLTEQLASERRDWTTALAAMVRAGATLRTGNVEQATQELQSASEQSMRADMSAHAHVCRLRLAEQLGGQQGQELREDALAGLGQCGVSNPQRFATALMPVSR